MSSEPKYIFTVGGVLSGLGKGITTASVGLLLQSRGYEVTAVKIDPYISVDAGTMRPVEHGEIFVTDDGGEIDQDLGNYERFLSLTLSKNHNITTGRVYKNVIEKERSFGFEGRDAEMFPDIVNEIKDEIYRVSNDNDFVLIEVGGTTGDLENRPFLHAAREIGRDYDSLYIMVTYLPFLKTIGELKTKPTQHAVARLREIGIMPDFIVTRNEIPIDQPRIDTISKRCFIEEDNIIDNPDTDNIYEIPLRLEEAQFPDKILDCFDLESPQPNLNQWKDFVESLNSPKKEVNIAMVGKYFQHGADKHQDVYLSVHESLKHAGASFDTRVNVDPIRAERIEEEGVSVLESEDYQGILIPQGWGSRGVEGKIRAARYARENKVPFLGLCFGMQMATIEFARNKAGLKGANTTEADEDTPHPIIHIMPDQKEYLEKNQYGGTIRLGSWPCELKEGSLLRDLYGEKEIEERHRHRYEFNNDYKEKLKEAGLIFSGTSPDGKLVEAIELSSKQHPFFVGTQFHPEYKSRPLDPHPIFEKFVESVLKF